MSLLDYLGIQRIYANGVAVKLRGALNLIGATVTDDPVNGRTDINIAGGGGGGGGGGAALSNAPPLGVQPGPAASAGFAEEASRADHRHAVTTAAPVAIGTSSTTSEGSSTALARADHVHALAPADRAKLDAAGPSTPLSSTAPAAVTKQTAATGVATEAARADHKHDVSTAAPSTIGTANTEGTATTLARSDHVHDHGPQAGGTLHAAVVASGAAGFMSGADKAKLDSIASGATVGPTASSTAPADVTKAAAAVGVATTFARADHKHDVTTAAPGAVTVGAAAAEGSATTLARSDHVHSVAAGTPVAIGAANAAGSASTFARSDHVHDASSKAEKAWTDNPQAGAYTLAAADPDKLTRMTSASSVNLTIPPVASVTVPLLSPVNVVRYGAGVITITAGAGVTLLPSNNLRLANQYDAAQLIRVTADTWLVKGEVSV